MHNKKADFYKKQFFYIIIGLIIAAGFLIRTIVLGYRNEFEDDECRLLIAISDKSYWQLFLPIGYAQSAPPLYLILLKFWSFLFKENEIACHVLPYLFSLGSMVYFYKLSEKFYTKKFSIISANLLFCINCYIIHFSSVIKQYSADVFVCLVMMFYLHNTDICKISKKQLILLTCLLTILPFISLPSIFFIGSLFLINLIKNYKNKTFYIKTSLILLPFTIIMLLYYLCNLSPSKIDLDNIYPNYWKDGFIYNLYDFIRIIAYNLKVIFYPNKYILFHLILFISGFYFCIKEKSSVSKYCIGAFLFCILAAVLHVYPFIGRVALFAIPIFIFLVTKPFDYITGKKMWCILAIILFIAYKGYNINYFTNVLLNESHYNVFRSKSLIEEVTKMYNPNTDVIIINSASAATFTYYSLKFNFRPHNIIHIHTTDDYSMLTSKEKENSQNVNKIFYNLENGKRYFVFLLKDYKKAPIFEKVYKNIEDSNVDVINSYANHKSKLLVVQKNANQK